MLDVCGWRARVAQGKTEQSRKDLDRLAIIRKQREEEAAARAAALAEKEAAKGKR